MSFFIPEAIAQSQTAAQPQGPDMQFLIMMIGLFVLMYFMIIRPQKKKQKEHDSLVANLDKGDEAAMTSGMLGKIVKVEGDYLILSTGNNIELKFQKAFVHAVLPKGTIKSIQ